ncbi:MAG TPA: alpha-amylase family glycosyl hydrolase, partial [Spirochaetia bacterium]|nr:alpha-amylase family glycosyl hydrolase [Spirochaetia bacterium]
MSSITRAISPGKPIPLGVSLDERGAQFAVFSRNATAVTLLLFNDEGDPRPAEEIPFNPATNRTGDVWHLHAEGIAPGQLYLYRVDGPWEPERGHRFNPNLHLLDPYAKATTATFPVPKCIVVSDDFDWQGDRPLNYPLRFSVIYETHVRGLTIHPSSGVRRPGTFLGVLEKIPELKELGITSVELLPIQEFDEHEGSEVSPETGEPFGNYWGYSTVCFFAPKRSYAESADRGAQVVEFKTMVREMHKEGIEVILDVVFNHTGEGNESGPTLCFKGLDNRIYYILGEDRRTYKNYSGTGNTLNCNNPVVKNLIMDCLHYWVVEMHVDGFRFDLGSILGRDQKGRLME